MVMLDKDLKITKENAVYDVGLDSIDIFNFPVVVSPDGYNEIEVETTITLDFEQIAELNKIMDRIRRKQDDIINERKVEL